MAGITPDINYVLAGATACPSLTSIAVHSNLSTCPTSSEDEVCVLLLPTSYRVSSPPPRSETRTEKGSLLIPISVAPTVDPTKPTLAKLPNISSFSGPCLLRFRKNGLALTLPKREERYGEAYQPLDHNSGRKPLEQHSMPYPQCL
ncbi:hypothetical protein KP509_36G021100 [Ceratopteris richardii]|uniref:Uncharacterized protein n=1 Tax=Ceratopteris richardii TaxID=49495 RepID=A0A8T2QCI7_CERRI|nr:hypothetical protein KP509_36G021100 [Ceratopteris richardii]